MKRHVELSGSPVNRPPLGVVAALMAATLWLHGCTTLPDNDDRIESKAYSESRETQLGAQLGDEADRYPGKTAFLLLDTGRQAFTSRANLVDSAEQAIDAQYYIWNNDQSGRYLAARLLSAADRGVKVRVLLDDFGIGTKDEVLFALDHHPSIDIRLYNPLPPGMRTGLQRWVGFLADFDRVAPRMHNKLMLVDGTVAVIGGRNIGDEYFDLHDERNFRDRDLMFHGSAVPAAATSFDLSWNSIGAYPITTVSSVALDADAANSIIEDLRSYGLNTASPIPVAGSGATAREQLRTAFNDSVWAQAEVHYNKPEVEGERRSFDRPGDIARQLLDLAESARRSVLIESGYLITGDQGLALYRALDARDVDVEILTNSLATNDVLPLHAGYTRSRPDLIAAGVALHELRPDAQSCMALVGAAERCAPHGGLSLHSKSIVFDDEIVYVGSFNLNPRSVYLNTENAVVVMSPELATRIADDVRANLAPENSWSVEVGPTGELTWTANVDGEASTTTQEPATDTQLRMRSLFYSLLPIEQYL